VTLLAFAAVRRAAAAPLLLGARRCRSISLACGHPAANPPQAAAVVDRWDKQTDRRTDGHPTVT